MQPSQQIKKKNLISYYPHSKFLVATQLVTQSPKKKKNITLLGMGGGLKREGTYIYLIHVVVQKKPTGHSKAIVFNEK